MTDRAERVEPGRGLLFLAGGSLVVPALAFLLALVAVPDRESGAQLGGPWMIPLGPEPVLVASRAGALDVEHDYDAVFEAWDRRYPERRLARPDVAARVRAVVVEHAGREAPELARELPFDPRFRGALAAALDPIVFPLHVGLGRRPEDRDPRSGLGPGLSSAAGTLREPFGRRVVRVDAATRTVALDGGEARAWAGDGRDVRLADAEGRTLYVDVSGVRPGFRGDVPVGVKGRLVRLLRRDR